MVSLKKLVGAFTVLILLGISSCGTEIPNLELTAGNLPDPTNDPDPLDPSTPPEDVPDVEEATVTGKYSILDLGPAPSFNSEAKSVNNYGYCAGFAQNANRQLIPVLFRLGSSLELGTLGGSSGIARDISEAGLIVGESNLTGDTGTRAFLYDGGMMRNLGTLGGTLSGAEAVNNAGTVVGWSKTTGDSATHGFIYSNGTMRDIGTLGGPNSEAHAINESGTVAGAAFTAPSGGVPMQLHAFIYKNNTLYDLGTLGGQFSLAFGINDSEQVVGNSSLSNGDTHAFLYSNNQMRDLGTLGGRSSGAAAINSAGVIVGKAERNLGQAPFIYSDGVMTNLNTLLSPADNQWSLYDALDINDSNQIVGYGNNPALYRHGFLLSPQARVKTASPSGATIGPVNRITLTFNQAIRESSFTMADIVSLTGPDGAIAPTGIVKVSPLSFAVTFAAQTEAGNYSLVIKPYIRGTVGKYLDQNQNGTVGEPTADRFTATFLLGN